MSRSTIIYSVPPGGLSHGDGSLSHSRAGIRPVVGCAAGRSRFHRHHHRPGRRLRIASTPLGGERPDRGNDARRAHAGRRRVHHCRGALGHRSSTCQPHRIRPASAGRHGAWRRFGRRAVLDVGAGRRARRAGRYRIRNAASFGHHRLGEPGGRRSGQCGRDQQREPDAAGPGGRSADGDEQRRAGRRGADPHPRRHVHQRQQRSAVRRGWGAPSE